MKYVYCELKSRARKPLHYDNFKDWKLLHFSGYAIPNRVYLYRKREDDLSLRDEEMVSYYGVTNDKNLSCIKEKYPELKLCPFCGSDVSIFYKYDRAFCSCDGCGIEKWGDTREDAIENWEERSY